MPRPNFAATPPSASVLWVRARGGKRLSAARARPISTTSNLPASARAARCRAGLRSRTRAPFCCGGTKCSAPWCRRRCSRSWPLDARCCSAWMAKRAGCSSARGRALPSSRKTSRSLWPRFAICSAIARAASLLARMAANSFLVNSFANVWQGITPRCSNDWLLFPRSRELQHLENKSIASRSPDANLSLPHAALGGLFLLPVALAGANGCRAGLGSPPGRRSGGRRHAAARRRGRVSRVSVDAGDPVLARQPGDGARHPGNPARPRIARSGDGRISAWPLRRPARSARVGDTPGSVAGRGLALHGGLPCGNSLEPVHAHADRARLALDSGYTSLAGGDFQRLQPDRRPGWPGCGRGTVRLCGPVPARRDAGKHVHGGECRGAGRGAAGFLTSQFSPGADLPRRFGKPDDGVVPRGPLDRQLAERTRPDHVGGAAADLRAATAGSLGHNPAAPARGTPAVPARRRAFASPPVENRRHAAVRGSHPLRTRGAVRTLLL